jgi:hypothetical protein
MTLNEMLKERDAGFILKRSKLKISSYFERTHTSAHARSGHDVWFKSEIPEKMRAPKR